MPVVIANRAPEAFACASVRCVEGPLHMRKQTTLRKWPRLVAIRRAMFGPPKLLPLTRSGPVAAARLISLALFRQERVEVV